MGARRLTEAQKQELDRLVQQQQREMVRDGRPLFPRSQAVRRGVIYRECDVFAGDEGLDTIVEFRAVQPIDDLTAIEEQEQDCVPRPDPAAEDPRPTLLLGIGRVWDPAVVHYDPTRSTTCPVCRDATLRRREHCLCCGRSGMRTTRHPMQVPGRGAAWDQDRYVPGRLAGGTGQADPGLVKSIAGLRARARAARLGRPARSRRGAARGYQPRV